MKKYFTIIGQSTKALLANKGRSFLTVLGIVIGIASVIALMGLGAGATESVTDRIFGLGVDKITINSGAPRVRDHDSIVPGPGGGQTSALRGAFQGNSEPLLTNDDLESVRAVSEEILFVSGVNSDRILINDGDEEISATLVGSNTKYFEINNYVLAEGALYEDDEIFSDSNSVVVGSGIAEELAFGESAVGKTFIVEDHNFIVVGVLEEIAQSMGSSPGRQIYANSEVVRTLFEAENYNSIVAKITSEDYIEEVSDQITEVLLNNHGIDDESLADFSVFSAMDIADAMGGITQTLTALLAGIAAISLLVGGIGIMNIMIVSVTERTREIGLRKAIGAKKSDIILQFITESVILTFSGGVIGVVLGVVLGNLAEGYVGFNSVVTSSTILLACGVSIAIGIIFGLYPAWKAAKLRPIEALRYE